MSRLVGAIVSVTLGIGALGGYVAAVSGPTDGPTSVTVTTVSCPTEDSCDADYHDGAWHVYKINP